MRNVLLAALTVVVAGVVGLFWPVLTYKTVTFGTAPPVAPRADIGTNADWQSAGSSAGGGQYSALASINRENVGKLRVAWTHHSGDTPETGATPDGAAFEATPIVVGRTLYYCTPANSVVALDAATGDQRWATDLGKPEGAKLYKLPCRGVSYWSAAAPAAACDKRIFKGDAYGRLFALDADTGARCTDFGKDGAVDLRALPYQGEGPVGITSPPAIYHDLVIVGAGIPDNAWVNTAHGIVRAFDARSGREVWHFDPIPPEQAETTGAANAWSLISVDAERGIVYLPTTSPSPDSYGATRPADIPLANAVVALNAETGAPLWHYQTVHHDLFDYDIPTQPILSDIPRDGGIVPAVTAVTKWGSVFVLNRLTGEPLFPIVESPVPPSDVPGEKASPTQPIPQLPDPVSHQSLQRADLFGLTWFDRNACRTQFDSLRYEGMFTPPSLKGSLSYPGAVGGADWGSAALDRARNVLVVRVMNQAIIWQLSPAGDERPPVSDLFNRPMNGTPYTVIGAPFLSPLGIPCTPPPWNELTAIDMTTGKTLWRVPLGQIEVGPLHFPASFGAPGLAGPMITGGGLVFVGGTFDPHLRAFDVDTGREMWKADLPVPAIAVPMTYEVDGQQFIVIAAGGSHVLGTKLSDALIAYALPK